MIIPLQRCVPAWIVALFAERRKMKDEKRKERDFNRWRPSGRFESQRNITHGNAALCQANLPQGGVPTRSGHIQTKDEGRRTNAHKRSSLVFRPLCFV